MGFPAFPLTMGRRCGWLKLTILSEILFFYVQLASVVGDRLQSRLATSGVAELRYNKCGQGMFWLPDLPRLRAIEIIGWIGNRNIPKLKIMNY